MADGPALSKHTIVGFNVQSAYGTGAKTDINWCPYNGQLTFGRAGENEVFEQADYTDWEHEVVPTGDFAEGDIPITLRGDDSFLDDLVTILSTRDSYNQATWFSVFLAEEVAGTLRIEAWQDCKVRTATFEMRKGSPVGLNLNCVGRKEWTGHGVTAPTIGSGWGVPFLWSVAAVKTQWNLAGSYTAITDAENLTLTLNENLEDPREGMRLGQDLNPYRLWNIGSLGAEVTLGNDFTTLQWYNAYTSHLQSGPDYGDYELGMQLLFTGTASLTVTMPRIAIRRRPRSYPGSSKGRQTEDISLIALGSRDGTTAAVTLAVS